MTASGIKFTERMMRLCNRVAPWRLKHRRKLPDHEPPTGPQLVVGRGLSRRRPRRMSLRQFLEILFWTLVVLGGWSLWNRAVWGWW